MRIASLFFFAGIIMVQQLAVLPSLFYSFIIFALLAWVSWYKPIMRSLFFLSCGIIWAVWDATGVLNHTLPASYEGQDINVIGTIIELPKDKSHHWQFLFTVKQATALTGISIPIKKILLSWYDKTYTPKLGETWQFTVRLKRPRGFLNPHTFDYSQWLFQQHIHAKGYIRSSPLANRLDTPSPYSLAQIRTTLLHHLQHDVEPAHYNSLFIALVIGERQFITASDWQVLRNTGVAHLLAISGLHISLIAGFLFLLSSQLWTRLPRLNLYLPAPLFAVIIATLGAGLYAALAGFSLPTQRAFIMVALTCLAILLKQRFSVSYLLSIIIICVLLWQPLAVSTASFYLSFGAVIFILYVVNNHLNYESNKFTQFITIQTGVLLIMFPLTMYFFSYISLTAFIANFVAIPWMTLFIIPCLLLASCSFFIYPPAQDFFFSLLFYPVDGLWTFLQYLNQFQWGALPMHIPPWWALLFTVLGSVCLFLPRGIHFSLRYLGFFCFLPLFFPPLKHPAHNEFWLTVLDVGQGLAVVVQTENYTMVYDTGMYFSDNFNAGASVIIPFLRAQGIQQIDLLIVSHADKDHSGGLQSLLDHMPIHEIVSSAPYLANNILLCEAGQQWQWDNIHIEMLHPNSDYSHSKRNNRSCVVKVKNQYGSVLLTGDIEAHAERYLLYKTPPDLLAADIMLIPHHGSRTSSTPKFIDAVSPDHAIASAGYRNRYGFPKEDIMARYEAVHIDLYNTAETGALQFKITSTGISVPIMSRDTLGRYWHH